MVQAFAPVNATLCKQPCISCCHKYAEMMQDATPAQQGGRQVMEPTPLVESTFTEVHFSCISVTSPPLFTSLATATKVTCRWWDVLLSVWRLVTIASLQRGQTALNNRLVICFQELSSLPAWSPDSVNICAFNYLWGAKPCSHHLVQVLQHEMRFAEFLHATISSGKKKQKTELLISWQVSMLAEESTQARPSWCRHMVLTTNYVLLGYGLQHTSKYAGSLALGLPANPNQSHRNMQQVLLLKEQVRLQRRLISSKSVLPHDTGFIHLITS